MQELVQFLQFWGTLFQVQLHPHADTITWTWIEKGQCSARSAYRMQFSGSIVAFKPDKIWKVANEEWTKGAASLPGWYFVTVPLQLTWWPKEDGHTIQFASYVKELLKQLIIFALNALLWKQFLPWWQGGNGLATASMSASLAKPGGLVEQNHSSSSIRRETQLQWKITLHLVACLERNITGEYLGGQAARCNSSGFHGIRRYLKVMFGHGANTK